MYDLVIIGSGYGGSVVASRLAGKAKVLVVERGKKWTAGDFPTTLKGLAASYRRRSNPLGLWEMRIGRGVGNAFASALGGASVVNYGITMKPEDYTFEDWPLSAKDMDPYYKKVRQMLQPSSDPQASELGDRNFIDQVAPGTRVDIENTIDWDLCERCGHCVPGCNYRAKRSLEYTYLGEGDRRGAEIWTRAEAVFLRFQRYPQPLYHIKVQRSDNSSQISHIQARQVVVAAGTFGTLDLFHRWREHFPLSAQFGKNLSMNGDGLAFLYNTPHRLSGHSGASLTTTARLHMEGENRRRTLTIMSGRIPYSMMGLSARALALLAGVVKEKTYPHGENGLFRRWKRRLADLFQGVRPGGALSQTYMYKLDGQDGNRGQIRFDQRERAIMDWPDYLRDPIMKFAAENLRRWAEKMGGDVIPDLGNLPGMRNFGVHPLGGCSMGENIEEGVVDTWGRVFHPQGGVYPGLRIADASVIPTSLGVPPSMTVAAVAERVAEGLKKEMSI